MNTYTAHSDKGTKLTIIDNGYRPEGGCPLCGRYSRKNIVSEVAGEPVNDIRQCDTCRGIYDYRSDRAAE